MKVLCAVVILVLLSQVSATGYVCYTSDGEGSTSIEPCFSASCYSVGGHVLGIGAGKKGCADKEYPNVCQSSSLFGLASEHVCFCNSFLCNKSASVTPSLLLTLLMVGAFLLK